MEPSPAAHACDWELVCFESSDFCAVPVVFFWADEVENAFVLVFLFTGGWEGLLKHVGERCLCGKGELDWGPTFELVVGGG